MSDALNYLMKIRPEVMKTYFNFVKQSAGHLDPKTRAIISVITKVDNQTETGLRQYLMRALQAGVSANEIIDALFVAFPSLGLSKIVWAVDIILDMDIPEFSQQSMEADHCWHDVIAIEELTDKELTQVRVDDRDLFVYLERDELKVFDSHCPHQGTNIQALSLDAQTLTCSRHGWKFDIRNGACIEKGDRSLNEYENRIVDGRLQVFW